MKTAVNYFWEGYQDGQNNKPRAKTHKGFNKACYERGYREGQQARTREATERKGKAQ